MIKPHVLLGADGIVLQSTPGPANGKTTSPLSECDIPAASVRLVRHPLLTRRASSDFAGLKDVYRVGELPSPSPSAAIARSLRRAGGGEHAAVGGAGQDAGVPGPVTGMAPAVSAGSSAR